MDDTSYLTVGSVTSIDKTLNAFRANSIIVNNPTNQWVQVQGDQWVQPYVMRAIIPVTGAARIQAKFAVPPGGAIVTTATVTGEQASIIADETAYPPSSGLHVPTRAPSTEWRNPKSFVFFNSGTAAGPQGAAVALFTYTCPAGRRAQVDTAQIVNELQISDGSGLGTNVEADIGFFPLGGAGNFLLDGIIHSGVVQGARCDAALPKIKELQATDAVQAQQQNQRGGGVTQFWMVNMTITEGDA